jgi:hypothetical protein
MKKITLIISLLITQLTYGQYEKVSVKELSESGIKYANKNVEVNCNKFESEGYTYIDLDGEPILSKDIQEKMLKGVSLGTPQIIKQETITIVDEYDELKRCYIIGLNEREFVDKYSYRDITLQGKIVDLGDGKNIGFKITKVEKRKTFHNISNDYPNLTIISIFLLVIFLLIVIYGLLIRYGIIIPKEE